MANRPLPTPEILRQLLRYEPETGKLFWRERGQRWFKSRRDMEAWNTRFADTDAFVTKHPGGYLTGSIFGVRYLAHRVIWAMFHGEEPPEEIDHRNLVKSDNRINNLRPADKSTNQRNIRKRINNTSGFKGVSRTRDPKRPWRACIKLHGKYYSLGTFLTPEDASAAYATAAKHYHGEYANAG